MFSKHVRRQVRKASFETILENNFRKTRERRNVKDQLEALVLQMYKSNILYSEGVREFKKRFILTVLQENRGNQCRAARELGMHRNTLSRTITELKIDVRQLRDGVKRPPRSARPMSVEKSMDKKMMR
jgi:Fis family transcriptional regulator, factor for inversion stimulation protein